MNIPLATEAVSSRPKIGLALSGGGARGITHIGVLKALEELQVPIDYIAGTSMGSIIGGLYASGLSTEQLDTAVNTIDWEAVFNFEIDRDQLSYREKQNQRRFFSFEFGFTKKGLTAPSGFIGGEKMFLELKRLTRGINTDFSKLPIPFNAVATDLNTADPYILKKGDLALALRASMAVPFVFAPVEIEGHVLVDGNILNNLPVDVVKAMGADIVIAINISTPLEEIHSNSSLLDVARQALDVALIQNTRRTLQEANIVVTPELEGFLLTDFIRGAEMIQKGYEAIMNKSPLFKGISMNTADYTTYRQSIVQKKPKSLETITPAFIRFTGNERTNETALTKELHDMVGRNLVIEDIEQIIYNLMTLNDFEQITYDVVRDAQNNEGLLFHLQEKSWGPHYFRLGLNATTSFDDKAEFGMLMRHEKLNIGQLGAEWINELKLGTFYEISTEFYQPISYTRRFFIAPYAVFGRNFSEVVQHRQRIAEYDLSYIRLGLDVGANFDHIAELRAGIVKRRLEADLRVGDFETLPTGHFEENLITFSFNYDNLDDRVFATEGTRIVINNELHREALGAETDYYEGEFYLRRHFPLYPQTTLLIEMELASFFDSDPPEYEGFSAGGFRLLAGYPEGDIGGENTVIFQVGALFNPSFLQQFGPGKKRFLGLLHAGNAWDSYKDISFTDLLFGGVGGAAWDTKFGTVILGVGYTENGSINYYLSLGNLF